MDEDNLRSQRESGVVLSVPLMDRRQFAQQSGLTLETVEAMIGRGYLPTFRVGRRSMINVALLNQRCLDMKY